MVVKTRRRAATPRDIAANNLVIPEQLSRIQKVRERLTKGPVLTDRTDQLEELQEWEKKAKKALIILSLRGNDGIKILVEKMEEELSSIDEVLRLSKPDDFSPDGMAKYAHEQHALFVRKELWEWFRSMFTDAKRDLREVNDDLDTEEEERAPGE